MKTSRALVGIDIGTSGLKASIFDERGNCLADSYRSSSYLDLPPGQMEQSAQNWWQSFCDAVKNILGQPNIRADMIAGIGICGFHHCPVFLQENGQPSRPVIQLHDERLPLSRENLVEKGVLSQIELLTKSMVSAAHFPPIFHYVSTHDPDAIARTRWIVLAKDYLRFRLTESIGTEICDATGLNLIEPRQSKWSKTLCEILSVPIQTLPSISSSTDIAGYVTEKAAEQTGLLAGTPVVYGGGDSHCALLGLGCIHNADTGMLLGTNSTLRTVFDDFVSHEEIRLWVQHHVIPHHYTVSASSMAGASVLNWFRQVLCSEDDIEKLANSVEPIAIGSEGLTFLPYIYGERCPFYAPGTSGAFLGLKHWHKREHFMNSVLEGVALNIANCFDLILECAASHNTTINHVRLAGGGSQLTLWHQIIADSLGMPIHIMNTYEAGTLGAAILAGIGTGIYTDYEQAVKASVSTKQIIEPNDSNHKKYLELKNKLNDFYRRIH